MKLAISLFFFLLMSANVFSCELKENQYLLLSSPITMLLEELDLLDSSHILAISSFHPVKESSKPRIGGGIFLSVKKLKEYDGAVVFFDESRELKKNLERSVEGTLVEVKSRGKDPFEVLSENIGQLAPYLYQCEKKIEKIKEWSLKVKKSYAEKKTYPWIFFLGEVKKDELPKLIIGNDLFIAFLKKTNFIKTYDSELAYVSFSEKLFKNYAEYQKIGLIEGKGDEVQIEKISKDKLNLSFRGIFSAGIRQIFFLEKLQGIADAL